MDSQWEDVETFLTQGPAKVKQLTGVDYQVAKGKWAEHKRQVEATFEVARAIRQEVGPAICSGFTTSRTTSS
jgi:hypothetical protein